MKRRILFLLLFIFLIAGCSAQPKLTETQKLESLARIWGFLKYYHPKVASGKINWDKELIQYLPKIKEAQSKEEFSKVVLKWIAKLGKVKKVNVEEKENTFDNNFNLNWTNDNSVFTENLITKLDFIEKNRHQGSNHYATPNPIGSVDFTHEELYSDLYLKLPDEGYRLLCLFRYWNIIEYFFPYKYQTDQDWDNVLTEMIPKFRDAKALSEYQLAVVELVAKINDSHAQVPPYLAPEVFGYYWIPAKFKLIKDQAVITGFYNDSLANINDIKVGDVIHKVNGEDISQIIRRKSKYISASNQATKLRDFSNAIFNGLTEQVTITYGRNGLVQEKQVKRYILSDLGNTEEIEPKWKTLNSNIGYVNMSLIEIPDIASMMESLMACKAIIFDVRNYPRGTMNEICKYLYPEPRPFVKFTLPDLSYPGKYYWFNGEALGNKNNQSYKGKVILLVNEHTQSHAEFTVMALQAADNTTVIGSQTAGADGNVMGINLVGSIQTGISGIGIFYLDGRGTQRIGIVPDIEVHQTIDGIRSGIDEILEKALSNLEEEKMLTTPKKH